MRIQTRLAERLLKINPSPTLVITSKAKKLKSQGVDIVSFAAGEPDFDTPDFVKNAAINAINAGFTKYTPTAGIPELKELICEKFKRDNGIIYSPDQIVVSNGAKHSIYNCLLALVNRGDEVLIPSPYWVSYPEMVHLCEGKAKFFKAKPKNNFKIAIDELERNITTKTRVFILNSPSNPTGCVYTRQELTRIAQICVQKKIFVISDEIYEKLIYDNVEHVSIASLNDEIRDLCVTVNGLSKSFSMTGWRIGYLGAARDVVEAIIRIQDHTTSNPVSISQKAAVAAMQADRSFSDSLCLKFSERRDYAISRLTKMNKITCILPKGAFYIFCGIAKTGLQSGVFAFRLLDEAQVAVIPGDAFGADDYIRISFATSLEELKKGLDRIEEWLARNN